MTLEGYRKVEMTGYSLCVVLFAFGISSAGEAQVEAPVRGLLTTRVEVERVLLTAALAHFRSGSCLLLLHMQVTSCEACM